MAKIEEILFTDIKHQDDFFRKGTTGDLDTMKGLENIQQALFRRLVSSPGSLVHRPDYGVGSKQFQNAVARLETKREFALRIRDNFERDSRVLEVAGVRFETTDDAPEKTVIIVRITIVGFDEPNTFKFKPFQEGF